MANKVTFHRAYEGAYLVKNNDKNHSYISRSYNGGWTWDGMSFGYLVEAKARCCADVESGARHGDYE